MMQKWQISTFVHDSEIVAKIKAKMIEEIARFKALKAKKSSKLRRYTAISEFIGENYHMMKCLQDVTENSEYYI